MTNRNIQLKLNDIWKNKQLPSVSSSSSLNVISEITYKGGGQGDKFQGKGSGQGQGQGDDVQGKVNESLFAYTLISIKNLVCDGEPEYLAFSSPLKPVLLNTVLSNMINKTVLPIITTYNVLMMGNYLKIYDVDRYTELNDIIFPLSINGTYHRFDRTGYTPVISLTTPTSPPVIYSTSGQMLGRLPGISWLEIAGKASKYKYRILTGATIFEYFMRKSRSSYN